MSVDNINLMAAMMITADVTSPDSVEQFRNYMWTGKSNPITTTIPVADLAQRMVDAHCDSAAFQEEIFDAVLNYQNTQLSRARTYVYPPSILWRDIADDQVEYIYGDLIVTGGYFLRSLSFAKLKRVYGNVYFSTAPFLITVNFPLLERVDGCLGFERCCYTPLSAFRVFQFPKLTTVDGGIITNNTGSLYQLEFDVLTHAGNLAAKAGTSIYMGRDYTELKSANRLTPGVLYMPLLATTSSGVKIRYHRGTSISWPSYQGMASNAGAVKLWISDSTTLSGISMPSLVMSNSQSIQWTANKLTAATVDGILARLVVPANDGYTRGSVILNGGTNASPTAAGIIDRTTLRNRGLTVVTN